MGHDKLLYKSNEHSQGGTTSLLPAKITPMLSTSMYTIKQNWYLRVSKVPREQVILNENAVPQ